MPANARRNDSTGRRKRIRNALNRRNRKFSDDDVRRIRTESAGGKPGRKIAQDMGCSLRTIYDLLGGLTYRDVV